MTPAARATVASFVTAGPLAPGRLTLGEDAAHHARVRRLAAGDPVTLRDGAGAIAGGRIERVAKQRLDAVVDAVAHVGPPPPVHLLAPVGDRDRMLWLAEKAVELGAASWRPARWRRSLSVSPRGEGDAFVAKVRARMASALEQSEGAWLPDVHGAADLDAVLGALPPLPRLLLDAAGAPMLDAAADRDASAGVVLAVGPEGGLEPDEVAACEAAGFRRVRLPGNILRFETAGVVGLGFARALVERARGAGATAGTEQPRPTRPRMPDSCLFCRIVAGEIPAQIVAESDDCLAFRDVDPKAPLHVLVIPRAHVPSLSAATDAALLGNVAVLAARVAREAGYGDSGFRVVMNDGRDAGQTVHHLHMHVLAGRPLAWPPG